MVHHPQQPVVLDSKKKIRAGSRRRGPAGLANSLAEFQSFEGRGVYVPAGLTATDIVAASRALERNFEIAPYLSHAIAIEVLQAVKARQAARETHPTADEPRPSLPSARKASGSYKRKPAGPRHCAA
jgi:hypothetical protein